jgi:hypothetical protein
MRITDFFKPLILKCLRKVALVSNLVLSENWGDELSGINPQTAIETWVNVTPPAFKAAIPVGATTTVFLCVVWIISVKVVFPVPAPGKENGSMGLIDEL